MNAERRLHVAANQIRVAVLCGVAIFTSGCMVYAAGGSALWAWGGTVLFSGIALAGAILGALLLREAGRELDRLQERFDILSRHACCGCGHRLSRHNDPRSADGFGCRDCDCQAIHRLDEGGIEPR